MLRMLSILPSWLLQDSSGFFSQPSKPGHCPAPPARSTEYCLSRSWPDRAIMCAVSNRVVFLDMTLFRLAEYGKSGQENAGISACYPQSRRRIDDEKYEYPYPECRIPQLECGNEWRAESGRSCEAFRKSRPA